MLERGAMHGHDLAKTLPLVSILALGACVKTSSSAADAVAEVTVTTGAGPLVLACGRIEVIATWIRRGA